MMPSFCHPPASHTENLLRTTPHLRHLSAASADMSGGGHPGSYDESRNIFAQLLAIGKKRPNPASVAGGAISDGGGGAGGNAVSGVASIDYRTSLLRRRANRRASLELASFVRLLSNEMSQDAFATVESEVYARVFALVHSKAVGANDRLAGVAALDALLTVPSADEERRAIRFGNNLSNALKGSGGGGANAPVDYEFLHAVARALGRMAMGAANVDRVEFEIGRGLEWLRSDRSDRRLAAVLVLRELARCAPTAFYSRTMTTTTSSSAAAAVAGPATASVLGGVVAGGDTNDFLDHIFVALRDPQPIVRVCSADALSECLAILMERQDRRSMTTPLCALYANVADGLRQNNGDHATSASTMASVAMAAHGSLLVVSELLRHSRNFILPRYDEVCVAVLRFARHPLVLIRLEVMRLIPRLAHRCPEVYGRRYLGESLAFLIASASASPSQGRSRIDVKPTAFMSIGLLALAMSDEAMGGGDITIPVVQIINIESDDSIRSSDDMAEEDGHFDYHMVELKNESDFKERMGHIFELIRDSLKRHISLDVLGCFANFVEALGEHAAPYVMDVVEELFESGLSDCLINLIKSIRRSVPSKQLFIERRLFQEISFCLAGKAVDVFLIKNNDRPTLSDPKLSFPTPSPLVNQPTLGRSFTSTISLASLTPVLRPKKAPQFELDAQEGRAETAITDLKSPHKAVRTVINKSMKPDVVDRFVLSLRTLRTMGESYMQFHSSDYGDALLPFLRNVISMYFDHPSSSVRQEAVITCCLLLLPFGDDGIDKRGQSPPRFILGGVSGSHFEEVLHKLLCMAVSDLSPIVRLCIVRGLDERYDAYLSLNLVSPLFIILEDEALAVRACALQILGRLSRLNPASILPGLRRVLMDLIVELRCGGDNGGKKEVATRLIIVFLREEALQSLTRPFISSIIDVLPLVDVAPRQATASLEALGEIATVAHSSIYPWLRQLISYILENLQDQNSSKQRISLWALGKIAFGTKYVVAPYVDYPQLLTQASDLLPTTKRAPWDLRREVFRTFGILGALSPDRFGSGSTTRKGGGKGGGYFVELEDDQGPRMRNRFSTTSAYVSGKRIMPEWKDHSTLVSSSLQNRNASAQLEHRIISGGNHITQAQESDEPKSISKRSDDDEPAHLFMYEQYAMTAQPLSKLSPARRLSPSDEGFFPTVAVQALMRILKDTSLSNLHGMVMKVCTCSKLGQTSKHFISDVYLVLDFFNNRRSCSFSTPWD